MDQALQKVYQAIANKLENLLFAHQQQDSKKLIMKILEKINTLMIIIIERTKSIRKNISLRKYESFYFLKGLRLLSTLRLENLYIILII